MVNWNSVGLTSAALASLRDKTAGIGYEVIVIDNGSTKDDSATELPARFPWVTFIANPDNRGFSKANNQGIRLARGCYVLLVNNDTIQIENVMEKSVRYMEAHPEVGALGILHHNNDAERTVQQSFYPSPARGRRFLISSDFGTGSHSARSRLSRTLIGSVAVSCSCAASVWNRSESWTSGSSFTTKT